MHPTDRGAEELGRPGEEPVTLDRLAEQPRTSVGVHPDQETPVERPATWPARPDDDSDETDDSEDA